MIGLYRLALLPLRLAAEAVALARAAGPADRRLEWRERLGRVVPPAASGAVWVHGSSVGEARMVDALARALVARRPERAVVVSAFTPTGRAALPSPPAVAAAFYAPLDLPGIPVRALAALRPSALALVETELWPLLLEACRGAGVPVVVVNGRLSERRMRRYRRLAPLVPRALDAVVAVGAQSAEDARRFRELGLGGEEVEVTGNLKFDLEPPEIDREALRRRLGLTPDRELFVAGSTGAGEEPLVLDAFRRARAARPRLLLVLAPRHPERSSEVERAIEAHGLSLVRWSGVAAGNTVGGRDCLLVDALGQLQALYALARVAFVGGTLVPVGGHNLLEPAAAGAAVLFGPSTENVAATAEALERARAGRRVTGPAELGRVVGELLEDEPARAAMVARARAVLEANRGALARSVAIIEAAASDRGAA